VSGPSDEATEPDPRGVGVLDETYEVYRSLYGALREDLHRLTDLAGGGAGRRPRPHVSSAAMDEVLHTTAAALEEAEAVEIRPARTFGDRGRRRAQEPRERARSGRSCWPDPDGVGVAVMKVSNLAEDPATLDMEGARGRSTSTGWTPRSGSPCRWVAPTPTRRRAWTPTAPSCTPTTAPTGSRAYDVLPGASRIEPLDLSDAALGRLGRDDRAAGTGDARASSPPEGQRTMLWDVQRMRSARGPMLDDVRPREARRRGGGARPVRGGSVVPVWPSLRAQGVHGDLRWTTALTDRGRAHHRGDRLRRHEPLGARDRRRVDPGLAHGGPRGSDELFVPRG